MSNNNEVDDESSKKSDLINVGSGLLSNINYKLAFFMFILGMFLFSDLFIEQVLSNTPGAVDGECATSKGTMIQLLFYTVSLIILDLMIKSNWL